MTDSPVRLMTVSASIVPVPVVADAMPAAASRYETDVTSADPPPLFLLHAAFIC